MSNGSPIMEAKSRQWLAAVVAVAEVLAIVPE